MLNRLPLVVLFVLGSFGSFTDGFTQSTHLIKGFSDPPVSAKPRALWDWLNGNFSFSQITYEMEEASRKGMGGFDIWDVGMLVDEDGVVPAGPPFLSEASLSGIKHAVLEAERLDMELGLIISSSWNAGGHWIPAEYGAMGLFTSSVETRGPTTFSGEIPFPELPSMGPKSRHKALIELDPSTGLPSFYRDVALLAIPMKGDSILRDPSAIIDISDQLTEDGQLKWEVPAGEWSIVRFVCTGTGQPLSIPSKNSMGRMLDHFSKEAMKHNLDYIISRLESALGSLENRALTYLYTDSYEVNSGVWTPLLPEEFQNRNGYSLKPYLPLLAGFQYKDPEIQARFQFDLSKTLSDLIIENHYRFARQYCARVGLGFVAEAGGPGPPVHNVPFEDLKALGALTVPRGEFWNRHPKGKKHTEELQIIKGIASAAHIYNQPAVEAEAFTSVWLWQEGPAELKPLADRAMCEGLNRFVYHTFPHTPEEAGSPGWVYNFGTLIHTNNSWWEHSSGFHEYLGRCSFLLQQGNFVGDVAYYYGDQAPNFVKPKFIPEELGHGYDYDAVNSEAILTKMSVENGKIMLPHGQSYELLVLPDTNRAKPEVLQKVLDLVEDGAWVVGRPPTLSHRFSEADSRDQKVKQLAKQLWGTLSARKKINRTVGKGRIFSGYTEREILAEKGIGPDLISEENQLDYIHRRTQNEDIYFIRNTSESLLNTTLTLRTNHTNPSIWDPLTGQRFTVPSFSREGEYLSMPFSIEGLGAYFISVEENTFSLPTTDFTRFQPTEEKVQLTLSEDWEVKFPDEWDTPPSIVFPTLTSWTEHEDANIQHFSGIAAYHKTFSFTEDQLPEEGPLYLDLGKVKETARVYLNGESLGIRWCEPYQYEISDVIHEGNNYLVVEVSNTLNNRLVGDHKKPKDQRKTKSNIKKGPNAWMTPWAEVPLISSGLLGPVQIHQ